MEKIIEKLDAIESANAAKITEAVDAVKNELSEKLTALEAKIAEVQAPTIIKAPAKTLTQEINRSVKEQLRDFYKSNSRTEKEIKMFESTDHYDAYIKESSDLGNPAGYGSGYNVGGRTGYDPVFVALRQTNPLRGVSRSVSTDGSAYQLRMKTGNAGAEWGYAIQNNGGATTQNTLIWQLILRDLNCQFPVRTATLDDIDGLESNIVADMMAEFGQVEAQSMILNNDQTDSPNTYGGTNGLRGLNQYGYQGGFAGGTVHPVILGSSGVATSNGLSQIATYDQLTTNGTSASANNITYADVINLIYSLPNQYWTESARFLINPIELQAIRGLVDDNGRPIYVDGLARGDGIVGQLLGFDVVVNKYCDTPNYAGVDKPDLYPIYFGDWARGHVIIDRLNMIMRRYDQTQPGFITFFGEKRVASSIHDANAIVAYRSTADAND